MKRSSTEMCAELREFDNAHGSTQALAWGKEPTCSAEDPGSIPGSGRSPGEGNGNHSIILAWRTPWTEEPGGLQSMGLQRIGH